LTLSPTNLIISSVASPERPGQGKLPSRIPDKSVLFEKVIPLAIGGMGLLTAALIVIAVGVLLGFVRF